MAQSPPGSSKHPEPSYGRRNFLKQSVVSLGVTVHEYVKHRDAQDAKEEQPEKKRTDWLRPPAPLKNPDFSKVARAAENVSMRARMRVSASSTPLSTPTVLNGKRLPSSIRMNNPVISVRIFRV